jgi:hypothetical protein
MRLLLAILAVSAFGQTNVSATFSPGRRVARGIYRWSMTACSTEAVSFDAGWAYQAAQRAGIDTLQVTELSRMAGSKGPLAITIISLQIAAQLAAYLAASGSIAAKPRVISDLLLISGAAGETGSLLKNLPADYVGNMLLGTVTLAAGACVQKDVFARKMKAPRLQVTEFSVPRR